MSGLPDSISWGTCGTRLRHVGWPSGTGQQHICHCFAAWRALCLVVMSSQHQGAPLVKVFSGVSHAVPALSPSQRLAVPGGTPSKPPGRAGVTADLGQTVWSNLTIQGLIQQNAQAIMLIGDLAYAVSVMSLWWNCAC